MESVKGWQQGWFYITEPRAATWAAAPEFKSGPPMRLTPWINKGLDWKSPDEVMVLESRVKGVINKNTSLASVIQVMLFRQILPCQCRTQYMWEFDLAGPRTLQRFFGTTHEDIWKFLFKTQKSWPELTEDCGYDSAHPVTPVSFYDNFSLQIQGVY